jgi:hypothetical protein
MRNQKVLVGVEILPPSEETGTALVPDAESATAKIIWRFWDAGYQRSFHGEPGVIDLGDLDA